MSVVPDGEARVTPLELFFDLVFVFAFTQVTSLLAREPTWTGMVRAGLVLSILWWGWSGYAWLTNTLDPEEGGVRLAVLAAVATMLIGSLAVPRAFGRDAVVFTVAYIVLRGLHLVLFAIAGRGDRELLRAVARLLPGAVVSGALLLTAGSVHGSAQLASWVGAAAVNYLGPLYGHMRGWRVSPRHFVERFGQIILIALGESIVAIGVGAQGLPLDAGVIGAALLGVCVAACLWWAYFDWIVYVAETRLAAASGAARAALARDVYSYLHLPMVGGIVLFAFGLRTTLHDSTHALHTVPAFALVAGVAFYFAAHVAARLRIGGGLGHGRPIASVALLALFPLATAVSAIVALGLVAAVCVVLITYEVLSHRTQRAAIRARRGSPTPEEVSALEGPTSER